MKIAVLYFSGTDVTRTVAAAIHDELRRRGQESDLVDITPKKIRDGFDTDGYDAVLFGFPVYGDFAPRALNAWFATQKTAVKPCALFCTYGARTSGYAHYHAWNLLTAAGYSVRLSAEFPGRHTFNTAGWKILEKRPDDRDLSIAVNFAAEVLESFENRASEPLFLQRPFGYDRALAAYNAFTPAAERGGFQPFRKNDRCSMCRLCERDCPTGAFDAETGQPDPGLCIACARCLYHCPDKVIGFDDAMYGTGEGFVAKWGLTSEVMAHKESRIIRYAWDTVQ